MYKKVNNEKKLKSPIIFIVGTVIAGLISFLNAPVLTRCLTTDSYVVYSMFMSFSSVITAISYIGYDSSYMRFYHKNDGLGYLIKCLKIPLILWGIISLAIFIFRQSTLEYILGAPISIIECALIIIYLFVKLLARYSLITMRMENKAWNYVISDCLERLIFIAAVIITRFVFGRVYFYNILICFIIGYSIEIGINLSGFPASQRSKTIHPKIVSTDFELFQFGVFLGITNGIMFCIPMIQKMVVRSLLNTSDAAVYFAASIFQTAISLISISINNIWEPKVYKTTNEGGDLRSCFHHYGIFVSWLLLTILGFVIAVRRILVYVLAEQYYDVYIIAPCITFSACMTIIYNFYSVGIEIKKKTWIRSIIPVIELIISVALLYLLTNRYNIRGVAVSMLIGSVISKTIGIWCGLKLYDTGNKLIIPIICWTTAILFSFVSIIDNNIQGDIIIGLAVIIIGSLVARKSIRRVISELMPYSFRNATLQRLLKGRKVE